MASRSLPPLRVAASRCLRLATPARSFVSATKPSYAATPTSSSSYTPRSSTTTSSTASKPTTTPIPSSSTTTTTTASRIPIPPTSGQPLPDADTAPAPDSAIDWRQSFHGLGESSFGPEVAQILQAPLNSDDIEVKPDGIIYLPEIKYRRILNAAFGPGGWGLAPRGELTVHERLVTREYALVAHGRFVGQARGEQQYFSEEGISTAAEGCKSNALMRCCKDLGIASELWDPRFIRKFMKAHAYQQWVEHVATKKKKQIWLRKDDEVRYPFKKS